MLLHWISQLNEDDSVRLRSQFVIEMGAVMQSTVNALSAVGVQCEVETAETDEFTAMFISRIGEQTE